MMPSTDQPLHSKTLQLAVLSIVDTSQLEQQRDASRCFIMTLSYHVDRASIVLILVSSRLVSLS